MKTDIVKQSLLNIQEDDKTKKETIEDKIHHLSNVKKNYEDKIEKRNLEIESLEELLKLFSNSLKKAYSYVPILEVVIILVVLCATVLSNGVLPMVIGTLINVLLVADITNNYKVNYKKIMVDINGTKKECNFGVKVLSLINKLFKGKKMINKELVRKTAEVEVLYDDLNLIKSELVKYKDEFAILEDELSYIEGCLEGVKTLENHTVCELNDEQELVQFVNKKLVLRDNR